MKAEKIRQAITGKTYKIEQAEDCNCNVSWDIRNGELECDISTDCCWESQQLYIDDEMIAEYIRYEGIKTYEVEDYPTDYEEDDDDSLWLDINDLIRMSEKTERGDSGSCKTHDDNVRDSLVDYITNLLDDGWLLYRDNERGFANEYVCILVAPTAVEDGIDDDWDEMSVDSWIKEYLYAGDAATEAYNSIKIID